MSLFRWGKFGLHSGATSPFLIDCDALDDGDLFTLFMLMLPRLKPFAEVVAIPEGGKRFGEFFRPWVKQPGGVLLVDDVFTTGASMVAAAQEAGAVPSPDRPGVEGVCIFARAKPFFWVKAAFTMIGDS